MHEMCLFQAKGPYSHLAKRGDNLMIQGIP